MAAADDKKSTQPNDELLERMEALESLALEQANELANLKAAAGSSVQVSPRKKKREGAPPTVTIGGKQYQFLYHVARVKLKDKKRATRVDAEEAAKDADLLKKLLAEAGTALFKEVKK